jgi:hypothetical protein
MRFLTGLSSLPLLSNAKTRSVCPENPTGEPGRGGMAAPDAANPASNLGQGWKVRPCVTLPPGETFTMMDVEGPGAIQHIWLTVTQKAFRDCVLRVFWDGEETPSVDVPLGDFFANGHGRRYDLNSLMVLSNPDGGLNCYWPMPFRRSARITVENQRWEPIEGFFYQVTYQLAEVPDDAAYFHAQWRRARVDRSHPDFTILDGVRGAGHYVGTALAWEQLSNGWWGEGEIKFYIDGDAEFPTICGTGTEDYFGGAWGFGDRTYSTPFQGYPLCEREPGRIPRHGMYRWHVLDPIRFAEGLSVTIQALGWWPNGKFQPLDDDIASVAYWYQAEPHGAFPDMPPAEARWPR